MRCGISDKVFTLWSVKGEGEWKGKREVTMILLLLPRLLLFYEGRVHSDNGGLGYLAPLAVEGGWG